MKPRQRVHPRGRRWEKMVGDYWLVVGDAKRRASPEVSFFRRNLFHGALHISPPSLAISPLHTEYVWLASQLKDVASPHRIGFQLPTPKKETWVSSFQLPLPPLSLRVYVCLGSRKKAKNAGIEYCLAAGTKASTLNMFQKAFSY